MRGIAYRHWKVPATLLLLAIVLHIVSGCAHNLFYYPDNDDHGDSPAASGLKHEFVTFASTDGTRLTGWFVPAAGVAEPRNAKGTVIQVHGNAGNMTAHWAFVSWLPARGFNVFMFDYRGYGESAGSPNLQGLFEDTRSAIDYVRKRPDVDPRRLVILAQSLGGNNAVAAVGEGSREGIRAMVIDSTFSSYSAIANDKLPGIGLLVDDRYSADRYVAGLAPIPLLFIHGMEDRVIPYRHSERLFALAGEPKWLTLVPGGAHIDALSGRQGEKYRDIVADFFTASLMGP